MVASACLYEANKGLAMILQDNKIFVAGHQGMVGSALLKTLKQQNFNNLVVRTRTELDLTQQYQVREFMFSERPDCVVIAAAKVGGIHANNVYPADFMYTNLIIECNLIHQAFEAGVKKILFLGSSCIYPKFAHQPMSEHALLTGLLEPTNEPYAIAKIAGIKLCESYNRQFGTDYRSVMPCNLYGPNDNFQLENSHVIPALIKKIHFAKLSRQPTVSVWGTGTVRREFLYVDDMASACLHLLKMPTSEFNSMVDPMCSQMNIGYGDDVTINELVCLIKDVIGYEGDIEYDTSKPDGAPRKLMDTGLINRTGWHPEYSLQRGLAKTYDWYVENQHSART